MPLLSYKKKRKLRLVEFSCLSHTQVFDGIRIKIQFFSLLPVLFLFTHVQLFSSYLGNTYIMQSSHRDCYHKIHFTEDRDTTS